MQTNKKRIIVLIVIALLAVPPTVRYFYSQRASNTLKQIEVELEEWEAERQRPETLRKKEEFIKKREKEFEQLVHGNRIGTKVVLSSMETISPPGDMLMFSALAVTRDSDKIAIAGGDGFSQNIYIASFPPQDEAAFQKIVSIPGGVAIYAMRWNDFDPNVIGLISLEVKASNDPSGQRARADNSRIVLYTIDTLKNETKEVFVGDEKMVQDAVSGGGWSMNTSLCWEHPDTILVFDGVSLSRIHGNGTVELVTKSDFSLSVNHILSVENNMVNLFGYDFFLDEIDASEKNGPDQNIIDEVRAYLVQVNLETKKITRESFGGTIERASLLFCNGNRLLGSWNHYDGKYRYMMLDKDNKDERTIVEVPKHGFNRMTVVGLTPDGHYAICSLSHTKASMAAYRAAKTAARPLRILDGIGLITLP